MQSFLSQFIQTGDALDLTILGDSDSTPFASLQAALSGLKLSTSLTGNVLLFYGQPPCLMYLQESINQHSLPTSM